MSQVRYYPEDELVEKFQSGEYGWLDYVNHHSRQWQEEYADYCKTNNLQMNEDSAEGFVNHKGQQFDQAIAEGEA